ncbi:MAG: hypothetical protein JNL73_04275 [Anaerolineales bacterium]|nr:hypothetical protein [Anaerolineales bacterium]
MSDFYEWAQAEPRALARSIRPQDLSAEFRLPAYINRLDLLQAEGPQGPAAALYQRIARLGLNYDLAPFDPRSGVVQKVRTPAQILAEGRATCLDLAVVFAATCLESDLLSLIVAVEGHAFAGFSLKRTRQKAGRAPKALAWTKGLLDDVSVLQELAGNEYALVECTGLVRSQSLSATVPEGQGREASGAMSFERACAAGSEQVARAVPLGGAPAAGGRRFLYALDIHDLQVNQGFAPVEDQPAAEAGGSGGRSISIRADRDLHLTGDLTGRDRITTTTTHTGDTISVGNISGSSGVAIGRGAQATVTTGANATDLVAVFAAVYQSIQARPADPAVDKDEIVETVQRIEKEAAKGDQAEAGKLERWVKNVAGMAPDILEVMAAAFAGPVSAAGTILKKVIERARAG